MQPNSTELERLGRLAKRLRFVGVVNLGLMAALLAFTWIGYGLTHSMAAASDPDDAQEPHYVMSWLLPWLLRLSVVCFVLFLLWAPAYRICLFKLKKLKKESEAAAS